MKNCDLITKDYVLFVIRYFNSMQTWSREDVLSEIERNIIDAKPEDAEQVVYCENCVLHKNCTVEDIFKFARMEKSFCSAGVRREE